MSEEKRSQGLCPLTPEESALILQALGISKDTQIYIAAGEIYGRDRRLAPLRAAFPRIVSFLNYAPRPVMKHLPFARFWPSWFHKESLPELCLLIIYTS